MSRIILLNLIILFLLSCENVNKPHVEASVQEKDIGFGHRVTDYGVGAMDQVVVKTSPHKSLENHATQDDSEKYGNYGLVNQRNGNLDKALFFYNKAVEMDASLANKKSLAKIYGNIGLIYQRRGLINDADAAYDKSAKLFKELSDKISLQKVLKNKFFMHKQQCETMGAAGLECVAMATNEAIKLRETLGVEIIYKAPYPLGGLFMLPQEYDDKPFE